MNAIGRKIKGEYLYFLDTYNIGHFLRLSQVSNIFFVVMSLATYLFSILNLKTCPNTA